MLTEASKPKKKAKDDEVKPRSATRSKGLGFWGALAQHAGPGTRDKHFKRFHAKVMAVAGADETSANHYLDSAYGRHLAAVVARPDNKHLQYDSHARREITAGFKKFKKKYDPSHFESEDWVTEYLKRKRQRSIEAAAQRAGRK